MAYKYYQGYYHPQDTMKYVGTKVPYFRSSWEKTVMIMFDTNPNIISWASESIKIPYQNPFTGKYTVYVPDFLVSYKDANGNKIVELIEVKPAKETIAEKAKSKKAQAAYVLNQYKWAAAKLYAQNNGIGFRVLTEDNIFNSPK